MKRLLLSLLLSGTAASSFAQLNFRWAKGIEGFGYSQQVQGTQVLPYKDNTVYMAGLFIRKADFDPGPGVDSIVNIQFDLNSYLSKYDSAGAYVWTKQAPGRGAYALDTAGNIYVAGMFDTTRDFDPGPGVTSFTPTHNDLYLMKLDKNYNLLWAKKAGTCSAEFQVNDIKVSSAGEIYVGGYFSGIADFNPTASVNGTTSFQATLRDGFLAKYSSTGTFVWVSDVFGQGGDAVYQIALDGSGNPAITGYTGNGLSVANSTTVFRGVGSAFSLPADPNFVNAMVAKYNSSGSVQWARAVKGAHCYGNAATIDKNGAIYFGGVFNGTVVLETGNAASSITASAGASDAYLAKLSPTGTYLWSKIYGSNSDDAVFGLSVDTAADVYVTGMYSGSMNLNPSGSSTVTATNNGYRDGFMARYTSAGTYKWSTNFGSIYHDEPAAIAVGQDGALYGTGYVSAATNLNLGGTSSGQVTFLYTQPGQTYQPKAYLIRYGLPKPKNTGVNNAAELPNELTLYPNPTAGNVILKGMLNLTPGTPIRITVMDAIGKVVFTSEESANTGLFQKEIHLSGQLAEGIYTVSVSAQGLSSVNKLVVIH